MAGDDEQRRLEARLRSGPERRLVELVAEFQAFSLEAYTQSRAVFEDIEDRLSETVDELRHLAAGLHPRLLTDAGLAGALEELARRSSISTALDVRVGNLPSDLEATAYFICAEAMANTAKHAAAEHMNVEVSTKAGVVVVTVIDDGVGGANPARGTGLINLHDRVEAHGGSLRVNDAIPHGTRLVAEFPLGDRH
jgi:signal transduction histidine kinase